MFDGFADVAEVTVTCDIGVVVNEKAFSSRAFAFPFLLPFPSSPSSPVEFVLQLDRQAPLVSSRQPSARSHALSCQTCSLFLAVLDSTSRSRLCISTYKKTEKLLYRSEFRSFIQIGPSARSTFLQTNYTTLPPVLLSHANGNASSSLNKPKPLAFLQRR